MGCMVRISHPGLALVVLSVINALVCFKLGWGKKVGAQFLFYLELKESVKHVTLASLYIYIYFAEEPFLKWIIFLTSGFDRI